MHWSLIISCGLITFFSRFSMIYFLKKDLMNERTKKILSFVPSAIFPAIIFPPIFLNDIGYLDFDNNPRIFAAMFAIIVGYFTKNVIATIFFGLASYWTIIFIF
ncbi:AzlD domain-containing protein [Candidatus Pelagibacter sp.]|nr:AzlD domain-containing protein [Candidatus Pelagibacter sp.]